MLLTLLLPASAQSKLSFGLQAGVGGYATTGSLHDNFGGAAVFTGGVTLQYGGARVKADVSYSQPSFNNVNMWSKFDDAHRDLELNANTSASTVGLAVQVGYRIVQAGRLSVTPAAGFHWSRYAWDVNTIEWSKDEAGNDRFAIADKRHVALGSPRWIASIDFDIRIHDKYTDAFGRQQRLRSSLRVTPFIAGVKHGSTVPSVNGCMLGCTVAYSGLLNNL